MAVDGPAASGKGTLARRLAGHFGFDYLETGLLYRVVALRLRRAGEDPGDVTAALAAADAIDRDDLVDPALRDEAIGQGASIVAAHPAVRDALLAYQRRFAATRSSAVLDGRDIGTVVCPAAQAKIYLDASVEVRALRRLKELRSRGAESIESRVLQEMKARDARDRERDAAPLKPAEDAYRIDTSDLDAETVFELAVSFVESRLA